MPRELPALAEGISDAISGLTEVSDDLQEISRGMHPAILSKGGLGPAIRTLARRSAVPVDLHVAVDQLAARIGRSRCLLRCRRSVD